MTTQAPTDTDEQGEATEPILCALCPEHEPFATLGGLKMHNVRVHADVPGALDDEDVLPTRGPLPTGQLDPAALAGIDLVGGARIGTGQLDTSPAAVLERQRANGGLWDPVTMQRVVVINGRAQVRLTVGNDAVRGAAERIDYFDPRFGWIREGLIPERGRMAAGTEPGTLINL